jgi:hypothetical protein
MSPATAPQNDEQVSSPRPQPNITKARMLAEHEFLAVLLFDPTESSAVLRESEKKVDSSDFVDPTSAVIAEKILPRLEAGTPYSMQELLFELDEECKATASTLYFKGQRISETSGSVMLALQETMGAFIRTLEDKAIADEVLQLKEVEDPKQRAEAAQRALETIRRQKMSRSVS